MSRKVKENMIKEFFRKEQLSLHAEKFFHECLLENEEDSEVQNALDDIWQSTEDAVMPQDELDKAFANTKRRIENIVGSDEMLPVNADIKIVTNQCEEVEKAVISTPWWKRTLRLAAMWMIPLLMLTAVALLANDNLNLRREMAQPITYTNYYAPEGEIRQITLPDSSKVWLHGGSTMVIASNFNTTERRVYLTGEGFFKVTHDAERKFVVSTDKLEMRVLGTEFNISSYPEESNIVTTLEKGSLQVLNTLNQQSLILRPGDQVAFNSVNGQFELRHVDAPEYSSWRYGYLLFNDIKVSSLLRRLEWQYDVRFIGPRHAAYLDQRVRARFNQDEKLNKILNIVQMLVPEFTYTMKGDTIYYK